AASHPPESRPLNGPPLAARSARTAGRPAGAIRRGKRLIRIAHFDTLVFTDLSPDPASTSRPAKVLETMDYQLQVVRGRSASAVLKLTDGLTTVGRHDDCQIRIKSSQVSRRHCELFEKKGLLLVKDLSSSN